jgi:hypothetical protein
MRRSTQIIVMSAIVLLYPGSGVAKHDTKPHIDDHLTAIWNACDLRFGPVPDPTRAKSWTDADQQRANDVIECFKQIERKLRDMPVHAIEEMIGL